MGRSKDSNVSRISDDEVAEIMEKSGGDDLTVSGRKQTEVSTNTVVEDRTDEPARFVGQAGEVAETRKLDNGTVLESYV